MSDNPFRALPSVSDVCDAVIAAGVAMSGTALTAFAQQFLIEQRAQIERGARPDRHQLIELGVNRARALCRPRLAPVINATGVILHTNLGRSPVSEATATAMATAAAAYVPLELEPESNERGGRMRELTDLLRVLTGAEATLVVNNNAAAVLLMLSALGSGREVIVSRGEAVEIGGGFRIPDVMRQSGARLIEVGTTNRTYARDYETAVTPNTAAILKVHASNFTIGGFTATATIEELAELGRRAGTPVLEDLGSGALIDTSRYGLAKEPSIGERVAAGADVVTASGDKLLGGPQAGIIAGRADLVATIAKHPLARAVRADKSCLAGLAATLRHYLAGTAERDIPIWRMISAPLNEIRRRGQRLMSRFTEVGIHAELFETEATIGGGSLPGQTLPSVAIVLGSAGTAIDAIARELRTGSPGVFGYIAEDRLLLDLRTVLPEQDDSLYAAVVAAIASGRHS